MAKAKGEIYTGFCPENGIAIMVTDNNDWLNWQALLAIVRCGAFADAANSDSFTAANIHVTSHGTEFHPCKRRDGSIDVLLPLPGGTSRQRAGGRLSMAVGDAGAVKAGWRR